MNFVVDLKKSMSQFDYIFYFHMYTIDFSFAKISLYQYLIYMEFSNKGNKKGTFEGFTLLSSSFM